MTELPGWDQRVRTLALTACAIAGTAPILVLLGWLFDSHVLKSGVPGLVAMNPVTAVAFALSAASLALSVRMTESPRLRVAAGCLAAVVVLIGLVAFGQYVSPWNLQVDRAFFTEALGDNRMAPNTALHFVAIGLALLTLELTAPWARRLYAVLTSMVLIGAMTSLLGYGYGARYLYGVGQHIPMALNTAALFEVIAVGLLAARPRSHVFSVLTSAGAGGAVARRLLPAAIAIPIVLGLFRVAGQQMGLYDTEFGAAIMVITTVVLLVAAIVSTAGALNRSDAERKQAQEKLLAMNEELERRVAERTSDLLHTNRDLAQKSQENEMFVYSVSHDLRSPLVSLQGFSKELSVTTTDLRGLISNEPGSDQFKRQALQLLEGDMQESIRFIQTGALRLSTIIEALLRLSRAGRVEYSHQSLDMNQLFARLVASLGGELFEKGAAIHVADLPGCHGDQAALEQLFANLIGNALKYRDPNRALEIKIGVVPPSAGSPEKAVIFVKDNGLGIPEAHQKNIFQAFKRAHPEVAQGDGMGLTIVRRIAERHGGEIWVESAPGQGSTFFVSLPRQESVSSRVIASTRTSEKGLTSENRTDGHLVGGRR